MRKWFRFRPPPPRKRSGGLMKRCVSVCPSDRLSVCPSVCPLSKHEICTGHFSVIAQAIHFISFTEQDHILKLCAGYLFFDFLKNCIFAKFLKKWHFFWLRHFFKVLYARYLSDHAHDSLYFLHGARSYSGAVRWLVIFFILIKIEFLPNFWKILHLPPT